MAQTLPDVEVTNSAWVDINTVTSIPVGTAIDIYNKGTESCLLYEGDTAPSINSREGQMLTSIKHPYAKASVLAGSLKIWAKIPTNGVDTLLAVQEV